MPAHVHRQPLIYCPPGEHLPAAFAQDLQAVCPFDLTPERPLLGPYFIWREEKLQLYTDHAKRQGLTELSFDFAEYWRELQRQRGRSSHGPLAQALGIKGKPSWRVFDATCGSGKDSFLIGSFGAKVVAAEENPWIFTLLRDALRRLPVLPFPWELCFGRAEMLLKARQDIDSIYFDPMYPSAKKKALPRKEMQYFRDLLPADHCPQTTLTELLNCQAQRVVIKRPLNAPPLLPNVKHAYKGKTARYDMYMSHETR